MQGVAEMLCLWPISGALTEFVKAFVDDDLGTAVGIAYWYVELRMEKPLGFVPSIMVLLDVL
jgi:amino acid transporter